MRQGLADLPRRLDEVDPVVVVLLDAGRDGKNVRIEDDVLGRKTDLFGEDAVGARADRDLAGFRIGLALLVEGHHHHGGTVAAHHIGVMDELRLALLERDGIHHCLALDALQAGFDDAELRGIDHHGHAGDVGLGRHEVEELDHGGFGIEQSLVHVDVDDLGAVQHLVTRHVERRREIAVLDQLAEFGRARDVGALAHVDEADVARKRKRLETRQAQLRLDARHLSRREAVHAARDGADVVGRGAAAAAHDVDEPGLGKLAHELRHIFGTLVVEAEFVGQAGIRIRADQRVGRPRDFGEMRPHLARAERAVEPDRQRIGVAHGMPEARRGLARQGAARQIGDGARDHHRQAGPQIFEHLVDAGQRRLGIERVEDGLDQDQVRTALDQGAGGFGIGDAQVVERHGTVAGIVDVRRNGGRAVGRPDRARDEARPAVLLLGEVGRLTREAGTLAVQFDCQRLHAVIGLGDGGARKGVGLDDVGAGQEVIEVDGPDGVGLCEVEEVIVAAQIARPLDEAAAAEVGLRELVTLNHRAHGAVEHQDALAGGTEEGFGSGCHE